MQYNRIIFKIHDFNFRCITPNDLNVFHKRFGAEISSKAVRKIIHDIDRTNKGKIYIEDFSAFIKTEI